MAIGIESAAESAVMNLDAAYANNPEGDIEVMKADAMAWVQSLMDDDSNVLALAASSGNPSIMVPDESTITGMITNATAYVQAALDAEGDLLEGDDE